MAEVSPEWTAELKKGSIQLCLLALLAKGEKYGFQILRELRSHIAESTAANGGNVNASLAAVGTPEDVGRRYRELYGFGRLYKLLFAIIAFVLAIPSVPVLAAGPESLSPYALSILFLIVVAVWILWVSVAAGSQAGVLAGVAG